YILYGVLVAAIFYILFFFQAEDGIRDFHVTGVQTCALPILRVDHRLTESAQAHSDDMAEHNYLSHTSLDGTTFDERISEAGYPRSEERRVGKECRSGWAREH